MADEHDPLADELGKALNKSIGLEGRRVQPDLPPRPLAGVPAGQNKGWTPPNVSPKATTPPPSEPAVELVETAVLRDQMQKYIANVQENIDNAIADRDGIQRQIDDMQAAQRAAKIALATLLTH